MFTINDFIAQYQALSDEELYTMNINISGYSEDAQKAFAEVLEKRGGIETIISNLKAKQLVQNEVKRIEQETATLIYNGFEEDFIKKSTTSTILSADEVTKIIARQHSETAAAIADKKITSKTISTSIAGCLVASLVHGIAWGLLFIYTNTYSPILVIGSFFTCFAIVKFFTRQSVKNTAVLIASIVAVLLAFTIGWVIYNLIGYRG